MAFRNFFYKFLIHFPLSSILSFSIRFTKHLTQYPLLHVKRPCETAFPVVCLSRSPKKNTALATKTLLLSDDVSKVALNLLPSNMVTVSTMPSIALTSKLVNRFGRFKPDWFPAGLSKCWFLRSALLPQFQWGPYCVGLPYCYFSKIQDKNRQNTSKYISSGRRSRADLLVGFAAISAITTATCIIVLAYLTWFISFPKVFSLSSLFVSGGPRGQVALQGLQIQFLLARS